MNRFVEVDGKSEYINDEMSLVDLIREAMGDDVADNVRTIVVDRQKFIEEQEEQLESDLTSYELSLESKDKTLNEVLDNVRYLENYLEEAKRINRLKLGKELEVMRKLILEEI